MKEDAAASAASEVSGEPPAPRLRRILAVGMEPEVYGRIEALLNRSYFEVDKVPRGDSGRVLCGAIAFDLVLVRYPLPDIDVTDLLAAVRVPGSPSAGCQVLLLADEARLFQAQRLVGEGADAALATERTGEFLSELAEGGSQGVDSVEIGMGDKLFVQRLGLSTGGLGSA